MTVETFDYPSRVRSEVDEGIRLDAWRSVFQRTNRILSEQKVTVNIVANPAESGMQRDIPAWSDGLDIYLSGPKVTEMLDQNDKMAAVLRLKGLNYHELCHVLFTPRMSDELCRRLVQKVNDTGDHMWWYAFNALEDQRIETWFTVTYRASRRYFEATILEWIIKHGGPESAVLVYGRKYLTPKIRVQLGKLFRKKYGRELYDEFKTIIDEYITLVLPTDSIRAMSLIMDYVELLKKMQKMHGAPLPALVIADNGGDQCPQGNASNNPDAPRAGRVYVKPVREARDKAMDAIDDAIDADIAEEARQDAEAGGQGEGKGGEGKQEAQSQDGAGSSDGDQDGNGDDQGDQRGAEAAGSGGGGAADSGTADHRGTDADAKSLEEEFHDLIEAAEDGLDEIMDDEHVQDEVDDMLEAVKAAEANGRMDAQGQAASSATIPPTDGANLAVRRVHDILSRIRQEAEPETLFRQVTGRIDPRRYMQRKKHEVDIFKTWDHGSEEETGVEAVVLVDMSGSMSTLMGEVASTTWALKRAFDKLDIRTTVLLYDTQHRVLYQPSEKAAANGIPALRSGGGTDPTSAFEQTIRILSKSQAPNKVLITVTDGSWGGDEGRRLRMMKQMHGMGVITMILGLRRKPGKHGHMEEHQIDSLAELPKAATKLVAAIMRAATV